MHWFNYTISSFRSAPAYAGYYANYMCLLFAVDNKSAQCHGYTRFVWFFFSFLMARTYPTPTDRNEQTNKAQRGLFSINFMSTAAAAVTYACARRFCPDLLLLLKRSMHGRGSPIAIRAGTNGTDSRGVLI